MREREREGERGREREREEERERERGERERNLDDRAYIQQSKDTNFSHSNYPTLY